MSPRLAPAIALGVLSLLTSACLSDTPARTDAVGAPTSQAAPGLAVVRSGLLRMAVVDTDGTVHSAASTTPGVWSDWQDVDDGTTFDAATAPVMLGGGHARVLALDTDGDVRSSVRNPSGWSSWVQVTSGGDVAGGFSAAETRAGALPSNFILHLAHPMAGGCRLVRSDSGTPAVNTAIDNCLDARVTALDGDRIAVIVRGADQIRLLTASRDEDWNLVEHATLPWTTFATSDVVALDGRLHVVVAQRFLLDDVAFDYGYRLMHVAIDDNDASIEVRAIVRYTPSDGVHAVPALTSYRGRLLALWSHPGGGLHGARWDVAAAGAPWLPYNGLGQATGRPQLVSHDHRDALQFPQQGRQPNYSTDAVAAMLPEPDGVPTAFIASRAMMRRDIGRDLVLYDATMPGCHDGGPDCPITLPTRISLADEDRPVISEIGFSLWMFPDDLVDGLFSRFTRWMCDEETWTPEQHRQCTYPVALPVYIKDYGGLFNRAGAWINVDSDHLGAWAELGHYFAGALGFGNDLTVDAAASQRSGIALPDLQQGRAIFATPASGGCATSGVRCPGFTGHANNYDTTGTEHSFLYAVQYYLDQPDNLRAMISQDLAGGDDLLQRKYDWIRDHIFDGVEF